MSENYFNPNVAQLTTPAIPLALAWADAYTGDKGELIDLSQAVPDYPPHGELLKELANQSAAVTSAGYGAIEGESTLREAYATQVSKQYSAQIDPQMTHITAGCNQAFVASLIALTQAGDRILLSSPCYFNHEASARMLGLQVDTIPCSAENGFVPTLDAVIAKLDKGARVVALVTPNNPTGAIYPAELIDAIFDECQRRGIWLLVDETYRDFLSPSHRPIHNVLSTSGWQQHFLQLYSFSKSLCIPGHRLGALVGGKASIKQIAKVMDNLQICAPRAAQLAAAKLLPKLDTWIDSNAAEIKSRETTFVETMKTLPGWEITSVGAYFAYVKHPFATKKAAAVVQELAQTHGVLVLPGSFFGQQQESYLRMAFANVSRNAITQLSERLPQV